MQARNETMSFWRNEEDKEKQCVHAWLNEWHARLLSTWMRLKINWQCQSRIRHINDQFDSVNPSDGHPHTRQFLRCAPQGEPEDAMMLQAFADRKDTKIFTRDVLQVSGGLCRIMYFPDIFSPDWRRIYDASAFDAKRLHTSKYLIWHLRPVSRIV